jgi:hypothetical protein
MRLVEDSSRRSLKIADISALKGMKLGKQWHKLSIKDDTETVTQVQNNETVTQVQNTETEDM